MTEQGSFGGTGKIYKMDTDGNVIDSREVGINPYSLAIANSKIYITNGLASNVSVITENDFSDVKKISVGAYPQEIISHKGKVFVANNSLYGGDSDSTVSVIDAISDKVIHTIHGRRDQNSFSSISLAISNDDHLLMGCPGSEENSIIYIVDINTFIKIDSFRIQNYGFDRDLSIDRNNDNLYFKSNTNEIVQLNLVTKNLSVAVSDPNLLTINGYGFDYLTGRHYLVDAKDFTTNGTLNIYNINGTLQNKYETSIAPRRITLEYSGIVSVEGEFIASGFRLEQNYPNPFNNSTTITYSISTHHNQDSMQKISQTKNVKIIVYDVLGNAVRKLVNENMQSGSYQVTFKTGNLTSGIYYYRLQAGDYFETRKMILLK
jgi:hypothetical protein